MPSSPLKYCSQPGCPQKVTGGACEDHRKGSEQQRGSASSRGYGARWRAIRKAWIASHPFCGDRLSGASAEHSLCASQGNMILGEVVDHIIPHKQDQHLMWSEANFQTLCTTCHNRKTGNEGGIVYKKTLGHRTVIAGAPGSGKTTWVKQHARPGDLVFDLDAIASTVAMLPTFPRPQRVVDAVLAMREGLLSYLIEDTEVTAFIIVTDPKEAQLIAEQIHASVHYCGSYSIR